jgi:hypothetical protein
LRRGDLPPQIDDAALPQKTTTASADSSGSSLTYGSVVMTPYCGQKGWPA